MTAHAATVCGSVRVTFRSACFSPGEVTCFFCGLDGDEDLIEDENLFLIDWMVDTLWRLSDLVEEDMGLELLAVVVVGF
jgi:hypothetical protein